MKRFGVILMTFVLVLGLTQCKKSSLTPTDNNGKVFVTLEAGCGDSKTSFDPSWFAFRWGTEGTTEYIYVGDSEKGYLGYLSATTTNVTGGALASNTPLQFRGTITAPTSSDKVYFYYLGNGSRSISGGSMSIDIDFSSQSEATVNSVANFLVASGEGSLTPISGSEYSATANLEVKIAIAYFEFGNGDTSSDVILYGKNEGGDYDIYKTAEVSLKDLIITPKNTTSASDGINFGKYSPEKQLYVALVPNTAQKTTLYFNNGSKTSSIVFNRGIKENTYYTNGGGPLYVNF